MNAGLAFGCLLAAGLLLVVSPLLWPWQQRQGAVAHSPRLDRLLAEGGFAHVAPRVFVVLAMVCGFVAAAVVWLVTSVPALVAIALVTATAAPFFWLRSRSVKLARTRRGMWPDVCNLLISSVRAGMSLPEAVASLASSAPAPLRPSFVSFERDLAASGHFEASIDRLKVQLSDAAADRIIESLRMARQVGGTELTPVLRALSASVRAESALRSEVEARQSWTRGAAVLGVAAPWVIVALLSLRPEGAQAYASSEGLALLLIGAVVSFVAYRVMLLIARLPEPRRWFA